MHAALRLARYVRESEPIHGERGLKRGCREKLGNAVSRKSRTVPP